MSMIYPDELIEEIRLKNDIVDVVSGYVKIQKKGGSYFGLCPFHNEKSPSFSVDGRKQMYYCFGCGAGGNVFTFIMAYENFSFLEAVTFLAEKAGVSLPEVEDRPEMKKKENLRQQLLQINKEAATYYYFQLRKEQGKNGYQYLQKRELTDDTMKKFGLGYASGFQQDLNKYLVKKGYSQELILQAGLASFNEKRGVSDRFFNRVMFPIQDINHRVIGFGGRVMGAGEPKYLNTSETPVFEKSRNLYGLNFARTARTSQIILCEGYMDVISMHQAGFIQAVASLGTALTSGQANLLHRYTKEVILAYDSDNAGRKAALRGIEILKEAGITPKVLNLEPYKDPDEFIKNEGKENFQKRIDEAQNSFFFEIHCMESNYDLKDPEGKTDFYKEIAKKLLSFEIELERENYLTAIAEKYQIGFENLRKLVASYAALHGGIAPAARPKSGIQSRKTGEEVMEEAMKRNQRLLITWLCEQPRLYSKIKKYIKLEDFTTPLYQKVAKHLFDGIEADNLNPGALVNLFEEEAEQNEVAALFNTKLELHAGKQETEKAFHDILVNVKSGSFQMYSMNPGTDMNGLARVIEMKKELEELKKTNIPID